MMNLQELARENKDNRIRIQKSEYSEIPKEGMYTHFNLGRAPHVRGQVYTLPRIEEQGFDTETEHKKPTLSYENILVAKCVDVKMEVPMEEVRDEDFKYSMSGIQNIDQLKERILFRYTKSRPHLSEEEILAMPITLTTVEILGEVKNL